MLIAEHSVKSPLAYHFKEIYGENQQEYLALTHYAVTKANQKTYNNWFRYCLIILRIKTIMPT